MSCYDSAGWEALETRAEQMLADAGRSLAWAGALIPEDSLTLSRMTRREAAVQFAAIFAAPPPSTDGLRKLARLWPGLSVTDPPAGSPPAAA